MSAWLVSFGTEPFRSIDHAGAAMTSTDGTVRPRVQGDREREVLEAALEVLLEDGYDRLTMDAVAARARASKATLYRRWTSKASLVVDALRQAKGPLEVPDTGSLRGDLHALYCGAGGLAGATATATLSSIVTAVGHDPEFAAAFRRDVLGPRLEASHLVWARARARGEVRDDLDLELVEPALAAIVLHRVVVLGHAPDPDTVSRLIDQIILPAATPPRPAHRAPDQKEHP